MDVWVGWSRDSPAPQLLFKSAIAGYSEDVLAWRPPVRSGGAAVGDNQVLGAFHTYGCSSDGVSPAFAFLEIHL